jgi:hypothetical protein
VDIGDDTVYAVLAMEPHSHHIRQMVMRLDHAALKAAHALLGQMIATVRATQDAATTHQEAA